MTKLFDKFSKKEPVTAGYLFRAEIPEFDNYIAISFIDNYDDELSSRFCKAVGINKVITAGNRKLKKFIKTYGSLDNFKSESILNKFKSLEQIHSEYNNIVTDEYLKKYSDFLDYVKAFEDKIKKYYDNKNVKIVVID